jgi:2'-5' RNA ligase
MRLFVAIELPPEVKEQLAALKAEIPGATWVKPPALHLTLRFLGDRIDPIRMTPIKTALGSLKSVPFPVTLRGTGRFPSLKHPGAKAKPARVLWVGIADQPALMALQAAVERVLQAVDFPPEERAYSPHITLARLKSDGDTETQSAQVARFLERTQGFRAAPFTVEQFILVSSLLTPQGPNYRHEATFPLTAGLES